MSTWDKLSGRGAKEREAAFEARMLAELNAAKPPPPPIPTGAKPDGIEISVTVAGQTATYRDLASIPAGLRQRIVSAWIPAQTPAAPVLPAKKPKSRGGAITLNLFFPGAGQFYLGQPGWGAFYALSFLVCFGASLLIFLRDYSRYLDLSAGGDILDVDNLEKLAKSFHTGTLGVLQVVALVIYIAAAVHAGRSRR